MTGYFFKILAACWFGTSGGQPGAAGGMPTGSMCFPNSLWTWLKHQEDMKNPRNNSFKSFSEGFSLLPSFRFVYLISPIEIKTNVAELESTALLSRLARKENSLAPPLMLMHEKSPGKISIYQARLKGTQQRSSLLGASYLVPLFVLRSAVIKKIAFAFRCHGTENLQQGEARTGLQPYMEIRAFPNN